MNDKAKFPFGRQSERRYTLLETNKLDNQRKNKRCMAMNHHSDGDEWACEKLAKISVKTESLSAGRVTHVAYAHSCSIDHLHKKWRIMFGLHGYEVIE